MGFQINGVEVISVDDAAKAMEVGVATVWRRIKEGRIETIKTPDRTYVPVKEVEKAKKNAGDQ